LRSKESVAYTRNTLALCKEYMPAGKLYDR